MLKAVQIKVLLAILTILMVIAGALAYHRHEVAKAAELREQQQYQRLRQQVERDKKKLNSNATNEGTTWQKYLP